MAFPVYKTASEALIDARRTAARLKSEVSQARAKMLAGDVTADLILTVVRGNLEAAKATFAEVAATPGIGAEAQRQYAGVPGLDIAAEFTAMANAVDATLSWLVANYPKDANGRLAVVVWDGTDGALAQVTFTPAQTAGLAALLADIDAAITTTGA